MHLRLIFLLILLVVLSNTRYNFYGEISVLEFLQVSVLFCCLLIILKNINGFVRYSNKLSISIKCFLIIFLLYEELSFLTTDLSSLFNSINHQSEINLHNAKIFTKTFVYFEIPLINYDASISFHIFVHFSILLLLGYGSYAPIMKKLNFIFLEKAYAPYIFIYILPVLFNSLSTKLLNVSNFPNLHPEFIELFIYVLFLSDVILKKKKMNLKRK